jgi:ferredoxin
VFVGGDSYSGPRFAIDAIAAGKEGAISLHRFVTPGHSLLLGRVKRDYKPFDKHNLDLDGYDRQPRECAGHADGKTCKETFKDSAARFTEEQVRKETERCLSCGATVVDEFACIGCGACTLKCKFDAIKLVKRYDKISPEFADLKKVVVKYVLMRKLKIAMMKPFKAVRNLFS